jgi:hypothetical protein
MSFYHKKTHKDKIWTYVPKMKAISQKLNEVIAAQGFTPVDPGGQDFAYSMYQIPCVWRRGDVIISYKFEDDIFMADTGARTRPSPNMIISDNIPIGPVAGDVISVYPEHMYVYYLDPEYNNRNPAWGYNCFMNRVSGDRSIVFYELIKRGILDSGLVSFNCHRPGQNIHENDTVDYSEINYEWQFIGAELQSVYQHEHEIGRGLIPYNNIEDRGLSLEQCIIDSNISLILETYITDSNITFSEKIFRALQLPRPWLLYCSPGAISLLNGYGFDVLDDYVDHSYDQEFNHNHRLFKILNQLETFINRTYTEDDYTRFNRAASHNQNLLLQFEQAWPEKFKSILTQIKNI